MAKPHLFSAWPELRERIRGAQGVLLGLDFDGTLSPIAPRPDTATLPPETKELLRRLARLPGMEVVVISGRGLEDLISHVGLPGLAYAGNHGLQVRHPSWRWEHPMSQQARRTMERIAEALGPAVQDVPGALLQSKGQTLSIHYRLVRRTAEVKRLQAAVEQATRPWVESGEVLLAVGKRVIEIKPPIAWGKGHALVALLTGDFQATEAALGGEGAFTGDARGKLPIYLGDDVTDEDAFRAIATMGISVKVGGPGKPTAARYRLRSHGEVSVFLGRLAQELETPGARGG